ncbi:streptophobe family protein [Streptomyces sp. NPDC002680]|uniref:streptophobe family protein n=1 Tax=Streptomyces sp. NPDC002680 TaxID=3364659 RepID=UPI00369B4A42
MSASPSPVNTPVPKPWRDALEGAAAGLLAVVAMAAFAAVALAVFDPGSVDSVWALTMAVTALAVGGSVNIGPDAMPAPPAAAQGGALPGGEAANLTLSGTAHVVPIAVTLFGAVVLWLAFSWRMRRRPFSTSELAARAIGAMATAVPALLLAANLGHGTLKLPSGADTASLGGRLGELVEKLFGAGGLAGGGGGETAAAQPPMSYHVSLGATVVGALVWVVVVLAVGLLAGRRAPVGFTARGLRPGWAPSLSAVTRTLLAVAAVMTISGLAGAGDHKAGGGAMLLAPVALFTALSLGLGSTWTSSSHQAQSPVAAGQQPTAAAPPPDHTQQLGDLTAGGIPLWVVSLVITAQLLLGCAYLAARATDPEHARPLHPYRGPGARHLGLAERFGVVTAVVLGGAATLAQTSFKIDVTMAGRAVGGSELNLGGGVLWTFVAGLLAGAVAGFAGSLLVGEKQRTRVGTRRSPVGVGGPPVVSSPVEPGA